MAPSMFPESRVRAPKTAIVITAKTTPYSAMVCPSSRDCSDAKSFCTCFTSLLDLGRQGGAADDSELVEKAEDPVFLEPLGCVTTLEMRTPNYLTFVLGVAAPPLGSIGRFIVFLTARGNPSVK